MKTIEEIQAEWSGETHTLTIAGSDGESITIKLYGNGRNAAHAFNAMQAESTRNLLVAQLETATTPEEATEVIRRALVAQAEYDKNAIEVMTGIDPLTQTELEEACDKHLLSYETIEAEADRSTDYKPLA